MSEIIKFALGFIALGCIYYYWHRCQVLGYNYIYLFMGFVFFPIAIIAGLYWAIADAIYFYSTAPKEEIERIKEPD